MGATLAAGAIVGVISPSWPAPWRMVHTQVPRSGHLWARPALLVMRCGLIGRKWIKERIDQFLLSQRYMTSQDDDRVRPRPQRGNDLRRMMKLVWTPVGTCWWTHGYFPSAGEQPTVPAGRLRCMTRQRIEVNFPKRFAARDRAGHFHGERSPVPREHSQRPADHRHPNWTSIITTFHCRCQQRTIGSSAGQDQGRRLPD